MEDKTLADALDGPIYSTRDLYLAASLVTLQFECVGIDFQVEGAKSNPIGYFKFRDTALLREARQKHLQGLLTGNLRTYQQNVHALKAEVNNMDLNPDRSIVGP